MDLETIIFWKERTKGLFHIVEYKRFWDYFDSMYNEIARLNKELNKSEKIIIRLNRLIGTGDLNEK